METLKKALDFVRTKTDFVPKIAVVLGSGLGGFADTVRAEICIDYDEIPGFPTSTVAGHKGRFVFGTIDGVPIDAGSCTLLRGLHDAAGRYADSAAANARCENPIFNECCRRNQSGFSTGRPDASDGSNQQFRPLSSYRSKS